MSNNTKKGATSPIEGCPASTPPASEDASGKAEQWIEEGKDTLNWTRLSCHRFLANQVRLLLFVLAYNLGNFLRRLALPQGCKHWSLRSLQVKQTKKGGRIVRHARHILFQLDEVAVSGKTFALILERIHRLRPVPVWPC